MSTLLYHEHPPTMVKDILESVDVAPKVAVDKNMKAYLLEGFKVPATDDYLSSRTPVLTNSDLTISLAAPKKSMSDYYYKNAQQDEMVFVHEGSGTLYTQMGALAFGPGDYLIIPRGMIQQFHFNTEENRLFIVESGSPIYTPKRYRNWFGQLLEHSPFCERDIRRPEELETYKRDAIIREASRDLAETQVEKLKSLVEDVDFDDAETFAKKVQTVKESYFTKNTTTNSGEVIEEDEDAPAVQTEGSMAQYLSAIKKTTK